jgi:RNA polymerase sigma-70 factor (ECF subfamily)
VGVTARLCARGFCQPGWLTGDGPQYNDFWTCSRGGADEDSGPDEIALDREPRPDEAAVLAETVEALFRATDDPDERAILELSLQGYTAAEISERLGRAERSVRRLRERLRARLERMRGG